MPARYLKQLDPAALGLLAEVTGRASRDSGPRFFADRPHDLAVALRSPEAHRLLVSAGDGAATPPSISSAAHPRLAIAIAINGCAEDICAAGLSANDSSPVDIELVSFAAQNTTHEFVFSLLGSFLKDQGPTATASPTGPQSPVAAGRSDFPWPQAEDETHTFAGSPGTVERLESLLDLCQVVEPTERGGALRLLGDEALFSLAVVPDIARTELVDAALIKRLDPALPRAVRELVDEISPEMPTLLTTYLMLGPVWYRMAAQNLLHGPLRRPLGDIARDFALARRFLVRIIQGPLAPLRSELFGITT